MKDWHPPEGLPDAVERRQFGALGVGDAEAGVGRVAGRVPGSVEIQVRLAVTDADNPYHQPIFRGHPGTGVAIEVADRDDRADREAQEVLHVRDYTRIELDAGRPGLGSLVDAELGSVGVGTVGRKISRHRVRT